MFKKESIKGFIAGIAAALTATAMATVFAEPVEQMISVVFDDYHIVVDGVDKTDLMTDAKPFVYNGRTYVPIRFVSETLGKQVQWDGTTSTVYINDDGSMNKDVYFATMGYDSADDSIYLDNKTNTVGGNIGANNGKTVTKSIVFNLNGVAKNIMGTVDMSDSARTEGEGKVTIYDQDNRILFETPTMRKATDPISFNVSTNGALQIRVEFKGTNKSGISHITSNIKIKDFRYSR